MQTNQANPITVENTLADPGEDPIFAAIERHRTAYAALDPAMVEAEKIQRAKARRQRITAEQKAACLATYEAESDTFVILSEIAPKTARGCRALLNYLWAVAEMNGGCINNWWLDGLIASPLLAGPFCGDGGGIVDEVATLLSYSRRLRPRVGHAPNGLYRAIIDCDDGTTIKEITEEWVLTEAEARARSVLILCGESVFPDNLGSDGWYYRDPSEKKAARSRRTQSGKIRRSRAPIITIRK